MAGEKIISVVLQGVPFEVALGRDYDYFEENWRSWESGKDESRSLAFAAKQRGDAIFIDVGAWIGCMTLLAARSHKAVYAFEADPIAVGDLERNVRLNRLDNVTVVPKVVSDGVGIQTLWSSASGNNSGSSVLLVGGKSCWQIEGVRLDEFIAANTNKRDNVVVKIDIEGAEYSVLPTIKDLIDQGRISEICLSLHPHLLARSVDGRDLISKFCRRFKIISATWRVMRSISGFAHMHDSSGRPQTRLALLWEIATSGRQANENRELFLSHHRPLVNAGFSE